LFPLRVDFFGEGIAASKSRAIDLSLSVSYIFSNNLQGNISYSLLDIILFYLSLFYLCYSKLVI
jgi:hypothetical protein